VVLHTELHCWPGGAAVPDPVRVSTVGELAALLRKQMIPEAVPLVCGVKVRVNDAFWPRDRGGKR
jgi:hypothetical protein